MGAGMPENKQSKAIDYSLRACLERAAVPISASKCLQLPMPSSRAPLGLSTINLGGATTVDRFASAIDSLSKAFTEPPHVIAISEFRECTASVRYQRVASSLGYHYVSSCPSTSWGVGLLVRHSVCKTRPLPDILLPGRLMTIPLSLHPEPQAPMALIAVLYGSCVSQERQLLQPYLQRLTRENCILMGDFNACTKPTDSISSSQ